MKWLFYVIVFIYMFYRAVYGAKGAEHGVIVEPVNYGDDHFLKVGEHKTISCKAANRNQKVEWIYPNGSVVRRIPTNRVFSQEHFVPSLRGRTPALVLTITKAEVSDTGVYQCRSGDQVKDVSLCVIEPSEFVETNTDINADIGRAITLSCQAKGNPEPRLVWNRNGVTITDEDSTAKYRVMTKYNIQGFEGLLTVTSLTPEDSGVYSCVSIQESISADDCSHERMLNITLNVNYAPIFENGNETNVYGKNNQLVDIVCAASGFPVPTYKWFKELPDESLLELDKKQIKFVEEENQAILSVIASSTTFGKRFKCQAKNELGTSDQFFTLLRMEKPSKIDEIVVQEVTDKAMQLMVSWYEEIVFPVTVFQIQYIEDENENRRKIYAKDAAWKKSKQFDVKVEEDNVELQTEGTLITLSELEPETNYYIRVRVTNDAGESPWSSPIQVKTLAEGTETDDATTPETAVEPEAEQEKAKPNINDGTFYGIFFAGGIFVVSFVCMLAMRMVR